MTIRPRPPQRPRLFRRSLLPVAVALLLAGGVPPARAAEGLDAAPTLKRAGAGERSPHAEGFLQRWLILEPLPAGALTDSAVQNLLKREPLALPLAEVPRARSKTNAHGAEVTWHAVDTTEYNVNLFHFARALGKPTSNVLFWGVTVVHCPEEYRNVRLAIGSNAASVWWVNGTEVIGLYGDRQTVIDDGVSKRLTLRKGANVIRCAIVNGGGATDFCARFLDASDQPLRGLTVRLEPDANETAATVSSTRSPAP